MVLKLPNYGWEGPTHYREWAKYLEWDEDVDPPPRVWLAHRSVNLERTTSCSVLLNAWQRSDCPTDRWDAVMAWLDTVSHLDAYAFETACETFFADKADWKTVKHMQGEADQRDRFIEKA